MKNAFCESQDLLNSADVEVLMIEPLLRALGYPNNRIRRKAAIEELILPTRGSASERYRPDYILMDSSGQPVAVVDAKHPINEDPSDFRYQVTGYALRLNQRHQNDNPVRYCVLTNGYKTELIEWDQANPALVVQFQEFDSGEARYAELRSALSYDAFNQKQAVKDIRPEFRRPTISEVITAFGIAHNVIWKKEKKAPTKAFYELAKLLFVKLQHDRRLQETIEEERELGPEDFYFTRDWVHKQPTPNPVANVLFQEIQAGIEAEILSGRKKRIFGKDESIDLAPSTVLDVIEILERFDLHGIDEDLNGRMFETFLNATVRGRELGQYFTPRSVVKYMTKAARLSIVDQKLPRVIDACCGSGGFLIEAMAELSQAITRSSQLTNAQRDRLREELHADSLYGIEANEEIARIARLNMYLHGDGGSRIYIADSLDKELHAELGVPNETNQQLQELRRSLIDDETTFQVALTNPPFSMGYSKRKVAEARILEGYQIATQSTMKSNVLFFERYYDLLEDGGELLTIIDDTLLNGSSAKEFRRFITQRFVIRQVVSLPFNCFFRASANIKTSIIHLRRKFEGEEQGDVFMAIANNVGHDDHKYDSPHRDNLPEIIQHFLDWDMSGSIPSVQKPNEEDEPLGCPMQVFVVKAEDINLDRLDAFYYAPELLELRETLNQRASAGMLELRLGRDFQLVPYLSTRQKDTLPDQAYDYIEISSVTRDGMIVAPQRGPIADLPTRAALLLRENDVLFAKNNSSRGTSVLVPEWMAGGLASSGFINVRADSFDDALILWSIFKSEEWRKQIYYLAVTASQPEVREEIFLSEMLIPWPVDEMHRTRILESAKRTLDALDALRGEMRANSAAVQAMTLEQDEE